jgi:hypothetical protein
MLLGRRAAGDPSAGAARLIPAHRAFAPGTDALRASPSCHAAPAPPARPHRPQLEWIIVSGAPGGRGAGTLAAPAGSAPVAHQHSPPHQSPRPLNPPPTPPPPQRSTSSPSSWWWASSSWRACSGCWAATSCPAAEQQQRRELRQRPAPPARAALFSAADRVQRAARGASGRARAPVGAPRRRAPPSRAQGGNLVPIRPGPAPPHPLPVHPCTVSLSGGAPRPLPPHCCLYCPLPRRH